MNYNKLRISKNCISNAILEINNPGANSCIFNFFKML